MTDLKKIQSIYLARHEFGNNISKDKFNRYQPSTDDFWIKKPVVSEYLVEKGFKPTYPGNKKFAVCISHDVDRLFEKKWGLKTVLNQQAKTLARADLKTFRNNFKNLKRRIFPANDLKPWLDLEEKYGIESTYFFLSLQKDEEDFNYDPQEIRSIFELLKSKGHEIGLHGGHLAYDNAEKMQSEKIKLEKAANQKISGYRNHYLKFDINKTWKEQEKSGFNYDSTFGHAETTGFRNGMAHPFMAIDESGKNLKLAVLPLMIMDATLKNYMKLNEEDALAECKSIIDKIIDVNGVLTLLWHNNNSSPEQIQLFESILDYLKGKDAFFSSGKNLIAHYEMNNYFNEINTLLEL